MYAAPGILLLLALAGYGTNVSRQRFLLSLFLLLLSLFPIFLIPELKGWRELLSKLSQVYMMLINYIDNGIKTRAIHL